MVIDLDRFPTTTTHAIDVDDGPLTAEGGCLAGVGYMASSYSP